MWGKFVSGRCLHRRSMSAQPETMQTSASLCGLDEGYNEALTSGPTSEQRNALEAADRNEEGLQIINGILSTIKAFNSYPPQLIKRIPLTLLPEGDETELLQCSLEIKTGGGECKKSLTTSFSDLFLQAGLIQASFEVPEEMGKLQKKKKKKEKG